MLQEYGQRSEAWRDAFEGPDEDLLAEAASEARSFHADPVAAVDELLRSLLHELAGWQQAIRVLGRDLTEAAQERSQPGWTADASRTEDVRWRQARTALLEAVARHHHGVPACRAAGGTAVVITTGPRTGE
ncbi:hypothetical protein ACFV4M_30725 [Kitasatospora indigofera]|uniref:hypothetical protein n=1 Tax=Kitasatospora indigofera TaxID=67307 RepID=UPI0036552E10